MKIETIRETARRERSAEQTREQADASWRAAWWETTLALAAVEGDGHGAVRDALATAAYELGQSVQWLTVRRSTGLAVDQASREPSLIRTLPPRLAVELAKRGPIDDAAADRLLQAERDGVSLREFARELGAQPPSWQREPERTVTPEDVTKAIKADPRVLGAARDAIRERAREVDAALEDPDLIARTEESKRRIEVRDATDPLAQDRAVGDLARALNRTDREARRLAEEIGDALRRMGDIGRGPWQSVLFPLSASLDHAREGVAALTARLDEVERHRDTGTTDMDAGLEKLLNGEGS